MPNNNENSPKKPEERTPEEKVKAVLGENFAVGSRIKRLNSKDEIVEDATIVDASEKIRYVRLKMDNGGVSEYGADDLLEWNKEIEGDADGENTEVGLEREIDNSIEQIGDYKKGDSVMVLDIGELVGKIIGFSADNKARIEFSEDVYIRPSFYSLEKISVLKKDSFEEADKELASETMHFSEKELEGKNEKEIEALEAGGAEKMFSSTLLSMQNPESGFFKKIKKGVTGFFKKDKGEQEANPEVEKFIEESNQELNKIATESSPEEKRNILRGIVSFGLGARQYKNEFMSKVLGVLVSEKGDKEDWSKGENAGALTRFLQKYSEEYHHDALKAKQNREDLYKPGGWLKRAASYGSGVGSLFGNSLLIYRLVSGIGYNPLRTVGAAALVLGKTGKVLKDVNLDRLSKETRVQDVDQAMEMAYSLYEEAKQKSTDGKVSRNDLEKVYIKNLPEEILEKLAQQSKAGKFSAVPEWIAKKEIGFSLSQLQEKLKEIEADGSISAEEKEKATDAVRLKYSKFLREMELMVENGGKVDMLAYGSRFMEKAGKNVALLMMIETLAEGVVKAGEVGWAAAAKAFESWDKSGGVSEESLEAIKKSVSIGMAERISAAAQSNEDNSLPESPSIEPTESGSESAVPIPPAAPPSDVSALEPKDGKLEKVFDEGVAEKETGGKTSDSEDYDKLLYQERIKTGLSKDFPNQKSPILPEQELSAEKYDKILQEEKKATGEPVGWKMPTEEKISSETSAENSALENKTDEAKQNLAREFYFREHANKFELERNTDSSEAASEMTVTAEKISETESLKTAEIEPKTIEAKIEPKVSAGAASAPIAENILRADNSYRIEEKLSTDIKEIFKTEVLHRKGFAEEDWLATKGDETKTFLAQMEDYRKNSQGRIIESLSIKRHLRLEEYLNSLQSETKLAPNEGENIEDYIKRALAQKTGSETLTLPKTEEVELKDIPTEDQKLYTKEVKIPVHENVFDEPGGKTAVESIPINKVVESAPKTEDVRVETATEAQPSQFEAMAKTEAEEDIKNIYHVRWYDRHGLGDWKDAKEQNAKTFMGVVDRFVPGKDHSMNASMAYHKKLLDHMNKLMSETGVSPHDGEKVEDYLRRLTEAEIKKINGVHVGIAAESFVSKPINSFVDRSDVIETANGEIEISREDEMRWMEEGKKAMQVENKPVENFVDRNDVIETENGPIEISREDEIRWMEEAKRQILETSDSKKVLEGSIPVAEQGEPKIISEAVAESERLGLSGELDNMSKEAVDDELDKLYSKTNIFGKVAKESGENSPYWKHVKDTPMENFQRFYDRYGLDKAPITPFKNEENEIQYKLYQRLKRLHQESGLKIETNETVSQYMHRAMKHLLANIHHSERHNQ